MSQNVNEYRECVRRLYIADEIEKTKVLNERQGPPKSSSAASSLLSDGFSFEFLGCNTR